MDDSFFVAAENRFYEKRISPRVLRVIKHQTGKTNIIPDRHVLAMKPGKRMSKTGHVYWETRKNRTDVIPKKKL